MTFEQHKISEKIVKCSVKFFADKCEVSELSLSNDHNQLFSSKSGLVAEISANSPLLHFEGEQERTVQHLPQDFVQLSILYFFVAKKGNPTFTIAKMDENVLWAEMPSLATVAKRGKKIAPLRTTGQKNPQVFLVKNNTNKMKMIEAVAHWFNENSNSTRMK